MGCGTGALSATLAKMTEAARIVGIDISDARIAYARTHISDPRVTFEVGDAQALPYPDDSFDRCVSLLIVNIMPDAEKAAQEMRRVTRSGGVVATTMWHGSSANELTGRFWDAAIAIDPTSKLQAEGPGSYGSAEALSGLLKGAGLSAIDVTELTMPCRFSSFDDYWAPLTKGQGPSGAYLAGLSERSPSWVARAVAAEPFR
jgi:SAM-dependent methyltransferase